LQTLNLQILLIEESTNITWLDILINSYCEKCCSTLFHCTLQLSKNITSKLKEDLQ
jgi:hypothetical protein